MPLLYLADGAYIGVQDVASATTWYVEKLGLQVLGGPEEGCVSLVYPKREEPVFVLGPLGDPNDRRDSPMIYASNVEKARDLLISRDVYASSIEVDRQGTHYFQIRDLDGNEIEITEEP